MQFYFIRHAQSKNNALWDATGSSQGRTEDPELSDLGMKQARKLGIFLNRKSPVSVIDGRDSQNITGFGITHLYCSLMHRAIQTGEAIAGALDLPLTGWVDAHEEGGIFLEDELTGERRGLPGSTHAYLASHFPKVVLPEMIADQGWWNKPYEEDLDRIVRAQRFYEELLARHAETNDHVAVVSHAGFYNLLMHLILKIPPELNSWFILNNAAITRIDFDHGIALTYTNRIDFLPAEWIT